MINGVYMACLRLSKVSIEFNLEPSDGAEYDPAKLTEITVPIELPGCVECRRYGVPEFGIVTGYEYAGEPLDEYDGYLCDRGYDFSHRNIPCARRRLRASLPTIRGGGR